MLKIFKGITLVAVFLFLSIHNVLASDWEYWSKYAASSKLTKKTELKIEQEFRMKSEFGNFYYYRVYIGPSFKISKSLQVAALYSYKTSEKTQNWDNEDLADADIELKFPFLMKSILGFRSRSEFSFTKADYVHRNRLKLSKDYKCLSPYVLDEFFYNFETEKLDENRLELGIAKNLNDRVSLELAYMLRHKRSKHWYSANVLQTNLKIKF